MVAFTMHCNAFTAVCMMYLCVSVRACVRALIIVADVWLNDYLWQSSESVVIGYVCLYLMIWGCVCVLFCSGVRGYDRLYLIIWMCVCVLFCSGVTRYVCLYLVIWLCSG